MEKRSLTSAWELRETKRKDSSDGYDSLTYNVIRDMSHCMQAK
jgi:hypothetical protein